MPSTPVPPRLRLQASVATALVLAAALAGPASAATLTVTPDATTYEVGDTITLSVFGDPEGERDDFVFGTVLFDSGLARHVRSAQSPLLTSFGLNTWAQGPLGSGEGFADAFSQITSNSGEISTVPLVATVVLEATATGELGIEWDDTGIAGARLSFFSLESAPGATVLIVPEPSTAALIAVGMLCGALVCRRFAAYLGDQRSRE